ncbi:hypothetical protein DTL42_04740 [Bremerella cremea]|uniref:Uncharacterized protein n=1 Tax=Bremerella cremea TaxID=1031537 RepID=A0A368KVI6_9BACT|nr:hypothetical protein DTL42_04740 [Bremerella cremea]
MLRDMREHEDSLSATAYLNDWHHRRVALAAKKTSRLATVPLARVLRSREMVRQQRADSNSIIVGFSGISDQLLLLGVRF